MKSRRGRAFRLVTTAAAVATAVGVLGSSAETASANRVLLPMFDGDLAAWSPDSRLIAVPETKAISLRSTDSGSRRKLRGPSIDYFGFPCEECPLGWSEDGARIQFLSHEEELDSDDAIVGSIAVDSGEEQRRSLGVPVGAAAWGPAGWPLIYVPDSRAITGNGKRVGPNPDLWRLDSLYAQPRKLLESRAEESNPLISPDGTRIAYTRAGGRSSSLWTANDDGTDPRLLVGNLLGPSAAAWSPDGRSIALSTFSRRKGDRRCHLYLLPASGGRLRQLADEEVLTNRPAWTPDGQWIAFSNYDGAVRKIRPDGTGLQTIFRLPGKEIRGLSWSPDGKHLAYTARVFPDTD